MSTAIVPCKSFASVYTGPSPDPFDNLITDTTTIQSATQKREVLNNEHVYELSTGNKSGWHALYQAALYENLVLIRAIFNEGGSKLLELGNKEGLTPLHGAVANYRWEAVHLLIGLGSPINITITDDHFDMDYGRVISGATPLDIALRTHNTGLVVLLLLNGGAFNLPMTPHEAVLVTAQTEIAQNRTQKKAAIDFATGNNTFPDSLLELIADYALEM